MKTGWNNTHIGGATIPCQYLSAREVRPHRGAGSEPRFYRNGWSALFKVPIIR